MCASIKDRPMFLLVVFFWGGGQSSQISHSSSMLLQRASGKCQSAKKAWTVIPGVGRKLLWGSLVPTRASWMQISYHRDEGVRGSDDFQSRAEVGRSAVLRKKYPMDRWLQNPGVQLSSSSGQGGEATHQCGIAVSFTYQFKPPTKYLCNSKCEQFFKANKKDLDKN